VLGHGSPRPAFAAVAEALEPLGAAWVAALQATVLPLVVTHLFAAVVCAGGTRSLGRLGTRAVALFLGMLALGGVATALLAPGVVGWYRPDATLLAEIGAASLPDVARQAAAAGPASAGEWVSGLVPKNLFAAAARGDILPILIFTALFGAAVRRLPDAQRRPFADLAHAASAAMLTVVRWVLLLTPLGVFSFTFSLALGTGGDVAGVLGSFVLVQSGFLLAATLLLYPIAALAGRVPVRTFASAVLPAQVVGLSTRSSLAALPALVEGGRSRLRLSETATGFVLPLSASIFKLNRTVSSTVKLLFLAHVYGIAIDPVTIATFLATVMLLSFTIVGVPGGGGAFRTLPAYLAAGLPIEGVVILEAVDTIPDIFKTLLNVTGDMTAAAILTRAERTAWLAEPREAAAPAPSAGAVSGVESA
jgi:proton glutamate symport protein